MPADPSSILIRRAADRGRTRLAWLESFHSFSFGEYQDSRFMGFRSLRVINDDVIAPAAPGSKSGFGEHPHRDMEILTWMLEGTLAHRDSMGNERTLTPGEAQVMTAGRGIRHSEFNASESQRVRLLQVWLLPSAKGLPPRYDQRLFPLEERRDHLCAIASPDGHPRDSAFTIAQDVWVYVATLSPGGRVTHALSPQRYAWLQVARGGVTLNGEALAEGDGAAVQGLTQLDVKAQQPAELMLFDLA